MDRYGDLQKPDNYSKPLPQKLERPCATGEEIYEF